MSTSTPYQLMLLVMRESRHTAWRHINPMLSDALKLAITAHLTFELNEFSEIVTGFKGEHWLGADRELWYTLAVKSGNKSAVCSLEHWWDRQPFLLNGERIHVGKQFQWDGTWVTCTSIADASVNVKVCESGEKKRVFTIHREAFDAHEQAQKLLAKERKRALEEADRADAVDLLPFAQHLEKELGFFGSDLLTWAQQFGVDYARAWKEWDSVWSMDEYLVRIGAKRNTLKFCPDTVTFRKRWPWSKVEQHLFRHLRYQRGIPLRNSQ